MNSKSISWADQPTVEWIYRAGRSESFEELESLLDRRYQKAVLGNTETALIMFNSMNEGPTGRLLAWVISLTFLGIEFPGDLRSDRYTY